MTVTLLPSVIPTQMKSSRDSYMSRWQLLEGKPFYFSLWIYNQFLFMTQNEEKFEPQEEETPKQSDTDFDDFNYEAIDPESDLDLEEQYVSKLKIQRKRIQELSQLHLNSQDRIQREVEKNKQLQEEVIKLSAMKDYQNRYNEVISSFEMTSSENRNLKDQLGDIKQELMQSSSEKGNAIQKLRMELAMQKDKESSRIQNLEDQVANKQEEIDKILREHRNREKQLQESISNLKSKINSIQLDHESSVRAEQRKSEKLERELKTCNSAGNEAHLNAQALLKENVQLREDNFRLTGQLNSKDLELKSHYEKFKMKWNSLKKDIKGKEKECFELKESLRKNERESSNYTSETEIIRSEMRRYKESFESERHQWQTDFHKEKQSLQQMISQQASLLQELESEKKYLIEENKRLQVMLRKKEHVEKQRKYLLKTEMKEIDKLEKVIDKIVE